MKKQNGLSRSADTCAKRKVKRSQLGGAKQVGAAGKKAVPAVKKHSAFGGSIIQGGQQAGERLCAGAQRLWKKITEKGTAAQPEKKAQTAEVQKLKKGTWKQLLQREGKFYGSVIAAAVAVIAAAAILCSGILLPKEYDILVNDAGRVVAASTTEKTVGEFLEKNGITLGEGDVLAVDAAAPLEDGMEIVIKRAFAVSITRGDEETSIRMLAGTVQDALDMAGITLGERDEVYPVAETMINSGTEITIIEVREETIVEEEVLYYKEVTRNDSSLAKGKSKIVQQGENGLERHTISVIYKNGVEVSRTVVSSEVVKETVDEITAIGTYVAPAKDTSGSGSSGGSSSGGSSSGGNSEASGSTQFGDVNAEGKLVSVPTIAQIHTGNLYEHKKAPEPDASIIAKTVYIDHVTAYTWTGSPTATGVYPKIGTIAADPAKFAYGTKVYVPGYGYGRIEDTGGFRGKDYTQFDLYMDSESDCRTWGRKRNYKVYILK